MNIFRAIHLAPLAVVLGCSAASPRGFQPPAGFVPDEATAIRIAEAVWSPVYGEKNILAERPFHAKLDRGVWKVIGTVPCTEGRLCVGGTAYAEISKDDGRIILITHYQ